MKTITDALPIATLLDISPYQQPNNPHAHVVFDTLIPATALEKSYSDQTGKLPVQSYCGQKYVMVFYNYGSNTIISMPLKTQKASELTTACTALHTRLQSNGYAPALHILDNKC